MVDRWTPEQVVALAPDASSVAAGRRLASPSGWSGVGAAAADGPRPPAVWGLCQGSGATPYQTVVDLSGPAYRCSCPSRKFPCKHALALLLLWTDGTVPDAAGPPDYAATWLDARAVKARPPIEPPAGGGGDDGPADPRAAARRAEQRADRVAAGLAELGRWLEDQVRTGLAPLEREGYEPFERMAARMVDAQAPGLAGWLRALPGVVASGPGWPGRLLDELALMALLVRAHERLDTLPDDLARTVRRRVGHPVSRESVLEQPAVHDRWAVLGRRDTQEDRLTARRVWLRGERTGRDALVLSFAGPGGTPDTSFVPGTVVEAAVRFHPEAAPLRAVVDDDRRIVAGPVRPQALTVAAALDRVARVLAADPWTSSWPLVLDVVPDDGAPQRWTLGDATGALPLAPAAEHPWWLLAVSGGRPLRLLVEWTPRGLVPVAALPGAPHDAARPDGAAA